MKTTLSLLASLTSMLLGVQGQVAQPAAGSAPPLLSAQRPGAATPYAVAESGPNHRVWSRVTLDTNALGQVSATTNQAFVELASGMSYLEGSQWVDSREEFEITPAGYAVANRGQYQVSISPLLNDAQGAVVLVTPDGKRLRSTPLGINLHDRRTGRSVLVAEIATNAVGLQIAPNEILFSNCFAGFAASVRFVYQKGAFHQDVVLAEKLDAKLLEAAGFSSDTSELQVWTEFLEAPAPVVRPRVLQQERNSLLRSRMAEPDIVEEHLNFGAMKMPLGKAYMLGGVQGEQAVFVPKRWVTISGRTFLVESVALKALTPLFAKLPPGPGSPGLAGQPQFRAQRQPPAPVLSRKTTQTILAGTKGAYSRSSLSGLVLDYVELYDWTGDFTFRSDTTYLVSGYYGIEGMATFEGGTVVKFPEDGSGIVFLDGGVNCQTGPYRMAVCTSINDNSVGEQLGSGSPATSPDAYFWVDTESDVFRYMRIAYAGYALVQDCEVWDSQFVKCGHGLSLWNGAALHNVLFAQCLQAVCPAWGVNPLTITGEHLTVDQCDYFMAPPSYGQHTADLTNCVFTALTNALPAPANTEPTVIVAASGAGIYQTVGAGNYYLAQASTNRNVGTTNFDANVLAEIKKKTGSPTFVMGNQCSEGVTWSCSA